MGRGVFNMIYKSFVEEKIYNDIGNSNTKVLLNPTYSDDLYVKGECDIIINDTLYELKFTTNTKRNEILC